MKQSLYITILLLLFLASCTENTTILDSNYDNKYERIAEQSSYSSSISTTSGWNMPQDLKCFNLWITTPHAPQNHNNTDGIYYTGWINDANTGWDENVWYYRSSSDCGRVYDGNAPMRSDRPPSIYNDYIAYKNLGSSIRVKKPDGSVTQIPGASTNTGPTLIGYQNELYLFYKGKNNYSVYLTKSSNGGNTWTPITNIFGSTNTIVGATVFQNRIYVFYKGKSSNKIYYRYMVSNGTWTNEFSLSSSESRTPRTPTVRTNPFENKIYLIYRGEDRRIYYRIMDTNHNWTPQTEAGPISNPPRYTHSAPDIKFYPSQTIVTYRQTGVSPAERIRWFMLASN